MEESKSSPVVGVPPVALPKALRGDKHRGLNDLRPMSCEMNIITAADGSARMRAGETTVVAAVYGPRRHRNPSAELPDRAVVEITATGAQGGFATPAEKELELVVKGVVQDAVHVKMHPRTLVSVVIQVVDDSGSLLATTINAVCLALLDSGVPMKYTFAAVCVGVPHAEATTEEVCLDLITVEEASSAMGATLAFQGVVPEGMAYATASPDALLVSHTLGSATTDSYMSMVDAGAAACTAVLAFVSQARHRVS